MNEKIKLFAEQVDKEFDNPGARHKAIERFAELIVRECIEINKQELAFNAFERLMNKYQDHFGVE